MRIVIGMPVNPAFFLTRDPRFVVKSFRELAWPSTARVRIRSSFRAIPGGLEQSESDAFVSGCRGTYALENKRS